VSLRQQLAAAFQRLTTNISKLNNVFPEGSLTLERYLWGFLATNSRLFGTPAGPVLVPLVDMLNHDPNAVRANVSSARYSRSVFAA